MCVGAHVDTYMQLYVHHCHACLYILSKKQNHNLRFNMYHGRPFGKPLTNLLICSLPDVRHYCLVVYKVLRIQPFLTGFGVCHPSSPLKEHHTALPEYWHRCIAVSGINTTYICHTGYWYIGNVSIYGKSRKPYSHDVIRICLLMIYSTEKGSVFPLR